MENSQNSKPVISERSLSAPAYREQTDSPPDLITAALLELAFVTTQHAMMLLDRQLRILLVNPQYITLFGLSAHHAYPGTKLSELLTQSVALGNHGGARVGADATIIAYQKRIACQQPHSFRVVLFDGRLITAHWVPIEAGGWVCTYTDTGVIEAEVMQVNHLSHHETVTGLPNRLALTKALTTAGPLAQGGDNHLLCLRLNGFREICESRGQDFGDLLMQAVSTRLVAHVRISDFVAHISESRFAILPSAVASNNVVMQWALRLLAALEMPLILNGETILPSFCIGIAPTQFHTLREKIEPDGLLNNAYSAVRHAGLAGVSRVQLYQSDMDIAMEPRQILEADLRIALEQGAFELYYQPLISTATQHVIGFEALLRWPHPTLGMVLPDQFIPLAEEMGVMHELGTWVLRTACKEAAGWMSNVSVAVNLSPSQFISMGEVSLSTIIVAALAESGLPGHQLELEITESVRLQQDAATLQVLHELRELGVRIALDDFGTGYSSLSYLRSFPFDKIKIDQSFVRDLPTPESVAIVRAIVALGSSLGMIIVAEGVETSAQLNFLVSEQCHELQGDLFSQPCPANEVLTLLDVFPRQWQLNLNARSSY